MDHPRYGAYVSSSRLKIVTHSRPLDKISTKHIRVFSFKTGRSLTTVAVVAGDVEVAGRTRLVGQIHLVGRTHPVGPDRRAGRAGPRRRVGPGYLARLTRP